MPSLADELKAIAAAYAVLLALTLPGALWFRVPRPRRFRLRPLPEVEAIVIIGLALILPPFITATLELSHVPFDAASTRRGMATVIALPLWVMFVVVLLHSVGRNPLRTFGQTWLADLRAGILAFAVLTPVTFLVYVMVAMLVVAMGGAPERHPLQDFTPTWWGYGLLLVQAVVAAPILEETLFRGILLPWARKWSRMPWLLFFLAMILQLSAKGLTHVGTLFFLVDLTAAMVFAVFGRGVWRKWPHRTAAAVVSTSALFGAMHAAVWPTPVPLTVMGVGLGLLTIRTNNVRPAIVCHALFNAVSALALLR